MLSDFRRALSEREKGRCAIARRLFGILSLVVLATTGVAVEVVAAPGAGIAPATYPGKNGKIAFIRNDSPVDEFGSQPCLGDEIWIMNPTGNGQKNITPFDTASFGMGDPVWSPDGTKLAFLVVYQVDVEQTGEEIVDGLYLSTYDITTDKLNWAFTGLPLPDISGHDAAAFCNDPYGPAWSPDGKKVAIQSYYGTATITLAKPNKLPKYLDGTQTPYMGDLAWSGAGVWAFEGINSSGGRSIDTAPSGSGKVTRLNWDTAPTHPDHCVQLNYGSCDLHWLTKPDWSPDGKSVVVSTGSSGGSVGGRIGFLDACSESALRVVDPNPRNVNNSLYEASWSPDAEKVIFSDTSFINEPGEPGGGHYEEDVWVMYADGSGVENLTATDGSTFESAPDWQPTSPPSSEVEGCKEDKLPIIFVPGFLGSDIVCKVGSGGAGVELWPAIPAPIFKPMALADDGVSNSDSSPCAKNVEASGKIVDEDFGYESAVEYLEDLPRKTFFYGYDWRKSPLLAVPGLDAMVDNALSKVKTDKVVLMAHSMGGLVARAYIEAFPEKVERVVAIGTPFLGAPKPWLALSHGWTTWESNPLDKVIPNGALKEFARNATGAYFLYPSEGFISKIGRWLSVASVDSLLDAEEVLFAVSAENGNSALLQQAYDSHSSLLEVYPTNGVDWQMVVGTGVKTMFEIHEQESGKPTYVFGSGDGTVPMDSAAMGNVQPSAVHYTCFAEHGAMAGARQVTRHITAYLLRGEPVTGRATPCPLSK